jgi:hypothetical protein
MVALPSFSSFPLIISLAQGKPYALQDNFASSSRYLR